MKRYIFILLLIGLIGIASSLEVELTNPGKQSDRIINLDPIDSGKIDEFLDLLDTPSSYAGSGDFCLVVNSGATAVEFVTCNVTGGGGGGGDFSFIDFQDSFDLNITDFNVTLQEAYDAGSLVELSKDITWNFSSLGTYSFLIKSDPPEGVSTYDFIIDLNYTPVSDFQSMAFQVVTPDGVALRILRSTSDFITTGGGRSSDSRVVESGNWQPLEDNVFNLGAEYCAGQPTCSYGDQSSCQADVGCQWNQAIPEENSVCGLKDFTGLQYCLVQGVNQTSCLLSTGCFIEQKRWKDLFLAGTIFGQEASTSSLIIEGSTGSVSFGFSGFNVTGNGTIVQTAGNITSGDWFFGKLNFSDVQNHPVDTNSLSLNLSGTNANQNINIEPYNLTTPKVSLDELAFPNASFKAIVTNDLVNGTAYGIYMNGQTGTNKPTFWIQPGGPGQASGIARTFLIVNEIDALQNTTNITSCSAWADSANEILQIDCNTSTSGADLIVGDDVQIFGDVWLKDSDGEWHFLTRELTIIDELLSNTMANIVDYSIEGNNFVINDTTGESFVVTIGKNFTILEQSNDSVGLNLGTDLDPQFNYISYKDAGNPTLTADTSEPSGNKAHIASVLVGASGSNIYGLIDRFSHGDQFVQGVYHRFFDMGSLYNTGFLPALNTSRINITSGTFDIMLDEYTTTLTRDSASDGFFFINSSGQFIQATDLSSITQYSDGTEIGNNKMVNVVWGVVPINFTEVRIMAVIQDYPGSGKEYVNVDLAEADRFNKVNIFPSDDFLKKIFVPVARTVFKSGQDNFQTLTNDELFLDIRGTSGGLGGSPPSPSITDHGDLDGLTDDDHTQYLLANGSRELTGDWNTGEFSINLDDNMTFLKSGIGILFPEGQYIYSDFNTLIYNSIASHNFQIGMADRLKIFATGVTFGDSSFNTGWNLDFPTTTNNGDLNWLGASNRFQFQDDVQIYNRTLFFASNNTNITSPNDGEFLINSDSNITFSTPRVIISDNLTVGNVLIEDYNATHMIMRGTGNTGGILFLK